MCGMRCVWELGWEVRVGRDGCAPGGDECWTKAKLVGGAGVEMNPNASGVRVKVASAME